MRGGRGRRGQCSLRAQMGGAATEPRASSGCLMLIGASDSPPIGPMSIGSSRSLPSDGCGSRGREIAEVLGLAVPTVSGILTRIEIGKLGRVGLEPAQRYERTRPDNAGLRRHQEAGADRARCRSTIRRPGQPGNPSAANRHCRSLPPDRRLGVHDIAIDDCARLASGVASGSFRARPWLTYATAENEQRVRRWRSRCSLGEAVITTRPRGGSSYYPGGQMDYAA